MNNEARAEIAAKMLAVYDAGNPTTEHFVAMCHDWAVDFEPTNPELAARLAAVELR